MANSQTVTFNIPNDYIGKELEVIVFAKNEGIQQDEPTKKVKLSELKGKLSKEVAEQMQKQIEQDRSDWEDRLNQLQSN
jgi:hypothetical protein